MKQVAITVNWSRRDITNFAWKYQEFRQTPWKIHNQTQQSINFDKSSQWKREFRQKIVKKCLYCQKIAKRKNIHLKKLILLILRGKKTQISSKDRLKKCEFNQTNAEKNANFMKRKKIPWKIAERKDLGNKFWSLQKRIPNCVKRLHKKSRISINEKGKMSRK